MGSSRTVWHLIFAALVRMAAPHAIQIQPEVPLTSESLRADFVLIRGVAPEDEPPAEPGSLRRLWGLLTKRTIVEFKSVGRPYRRRDLYRLCSQLALYYANDDPPGLQTADDLGGMLVVPKRTPTLDEDVAALHLDWQDLGGGYYRLNGGMFGLHVVTLDAVAKEEGDDLVELLATGEITTARARRWLSEQLGGEKVSMAMRELEGYDELMQKLLQSLPPEQVAAALTPEQVAALKPEQVLLALPDEALRALSDSYLATLPESVRAAVRARIGR